MVGSCYPIDCLYRVSLNEGVNERVSLSMIERNKFVSELVTMSVSLSDWKGE